MGPNQMYIDFNRTYLRLLDRVEQELRYGWVRLLIFLVSLLGLAGLSYLLFGVWLWPSYLYLGFALLGLFVFVLVEGYLGYYGFLRNYMEKVHFRSENLVDYLDLSVYRLLKKEGGQIRVPDLILELGQTDKRVDIFIRRLEIAPEWLREVLLKEQGPEVELKKLLQEAWGLAFAQGRKKIDSLLLLIVLLEYFPLTAALLHRKRIERTDLLLLYRWLSSQEEKGFFVVRFTGGIARDWTVGYSPILDRFATNLAFLNTAEWETLAHKESKEELKKVLLQSRRGNVLLVGRPGVGKRSLVISLAQDLREGRCPLSLAYKRILEIKMDRVLTVGKDEAGIRALFGEIIRDVFRAGDVILYFDDFSVLCGGGKALGKANLIDLLLPYLRHPSFQLIASISPSDYEHYIARNEALLEEFNVLEIKEPNFTENVLILEGVASALEYRGEIFFTYLALRRVIELAQRFLWQEPFPIKSIHLLEKIAQKASTQSQSFITQDLVDEFFEAFTRVKVGKVSQEEREILTNLEEILHQRIVDQEEALRLLAEAIRIRRAGIKSSHKPVGSFLFLGPTGVGKTEAAKALTEVYFGSEGALIRFDMSEFQTKKDVYRFIGHFETNLPGQLTEAVKENPSGVILLDEFEKAHPDILNLFLQILDEGFLTDVFGQKVYFTNHIIIATSNAGSNRIAEWLRQGKSYKEVSKDLVSYLIRARLFRAELLNRFDRVVVFKPLSPEDIYKIAELKLAQLTEEIYRLKRIKLKVEPEAIKFLARLGYKPEFGARELERVIREKIESLLAEKIIQGEVSSGGEIVVSLQDFQRKGS